MTLAFSGHAFQRLQERFGWTRSAREAAAQLQAFPSVRFAAATVGRSRVYLAELDMKLVIEDGVVITVTRMTDAYSRQRRRRA